jgi:hypothetical protein
VHDVKSGRQRLRTNKKNVYVFCRDSCHIKGAGEGWGDIVRIKFAPARSGDEREVAISGNSLSSALTLSTSPSAATR